MGDINDLASAPPLYSELENMCVFDSTPTSFLGTFISFHGEEEQAIYAADSNDSRFSRSFPIIFIWQMSSMRLHVRLEIIFLTNDTKFVAAFQCREFAYFIARQEPYSDGEWEITPGGSRLFQIPRSVHRQQFPYTDLLMQCKVLIENSFTNGFNRM